MRGDGHEESTAGPWLLGIILLALVVWVASMLSRTGGEHADEAVPAPVHSLASSAAFTGWVRDSAATAQQTLPPREFVTAALRRMTLALSGLVSHVAPALTADLERVDADVSAFVADTSAGARHVRAALDNAIALVHSMQERVPATADVEALEQALDRAREAAGAVEPEGEIEEQTLLVDRALRELAAAVHIVARTAGAP